MSGCVVGLVTCGTRAEARRVAQAVLAAKAAACVNILAGIESHYWWRGKIETGSEWLLVVKTTRARIKEVERIVKKTHSYEVPEIIFLPIAAGERRYLQWLRAGVAALILGVCAHTGYADQVDDLVKQLGATEEEARAEAAETLTRIGGPKVERQFREMLQSGNPERRQMAVVGLLHVSETDADLELVRARLQDENSTVRWSAVLALGQSGRVEALPWLETVASQDEAESVREAATEAVARLRSVIPWQRSIGEAQRLAKPLGKPVLVYFRLPGSVHCQDFEEGVLADRAVVGAVQEFVPVRLDAGREAGEARRHDVRGAPTIVIMDSQGNEMARVAGLVDKATLLAQLAEVRRSKLTFREAKRQALSNPADVRANWKMAQTYLEDGREDLAEPHLRNVVAHDEANQLGFTDDALFALGFVLGKQAKYPQAIYCLERVVQRWPGFKDKDKTLYCLGLCQLAVGQKEKGRGTLEQLLSEFPSSSAVGGAQKALERLAGNEANR